MTSSRGHERGDSPQLASLPATVLSGVLPPTAVPAHHVCDGAAPSPHIQPLLVMGARCLQPTVHPSVDTCTRPASLTCMHESMQPTAQAQQLSLSPRKPGYPHRPRAAACCDSAAPAAAQRSRGRNPRLCFRRCYHHLGGETAQQRASRGLPERPVAGHTGDCGRTGREQHTPRSDARDSAASLLSPRRAKHARPLVCGFLFRVFYYSVSRIFRRPGTDWE